MLNSLLLVDVVDVVDDCALTVLMNWRRPSLSAMRSGKSLVTMSANSAAAAARLRLRTAHHPPAIATTVDGRFCELAQSSSRRCFGL